MVTVARLPSAAWTWAFGEGKNTTSAVNARAAARKITIPKRIKAIDNFPAVRAVICKSADGDLRIPVSRQAPRSKLLAFAGVVSRKFAASEKNQPSELVSLTRSQFLASSTGRQRSPESQDSRRR